MLEMQHKQTSTQYCLLKDWISSISRRVKNSLPTRNWELPDKTSKQAKNPWPPPRKTFHRPRMRLILLTTTWILLENLRTENVSKAPRQRTMQLRRLLTNWFSKKLMLRRSSTHCLKTFLPSSKNWLMQRKPRRTSWKDLLVKPTDSISTLTLVHMIQKLMDHQSFHQRKMNPLVKMTHPPLMEAIPQPLTEAIPQPLTMVEIQTPPLITEHNESARKGWTAHL